MFLHPCQAVKNQKDQKAVIRGAGKKERKDVFHSILHALQTLIFIFCSYGVIVADIA
jgi:hypothetical protein